MTEIVTDDLIQKLLAAADFEPLALNTTLFKQDIQDFISSHLAHIQQRKRLARGDQTTTKVIKDRQDLEARASESIRSALATLEHPALSAKLRQYTQSSYLDDRRDAGVYVVNRLPNIWALQRGMKELAELLQPLKLDHRTALEGSPSDTDLFVMGAAEIYKSHIREPATSHEGPFARFCVELSKQSLQRAIKGTSVKKSMGIWRTARATGSWPKAE